jgi:hypothetical protein
MLYVIYTPSNDSSTSPSVCHTVVGEDLDQQQVGEILEGINGSICQLVTYADWMDFDTSMESEDADFYRNRNYQF